MSAEERLLSTGLVFVAGYAAKIRRTIFAQTRDDISNGVIEKTEVAKAMGNLNATLFKILIEKLNLDKRDVVRVRIPYTIDNGTIKWHWDKLEIEAYRKYEIPNLEEKVKEALSEAEATQ
ncbi:DUF2258 domain-containing protein [archaeon]|nr:MAG: DUF2258 domain-containing protein [archaeon]